MRPAAATKPSPAACLPAQPPADGYDGTGPFPDGGQPPGTVQSRLRAAVTAAFVVVPFTGLGAAVWLADPVMRAISAAFPALYAVSPAVPFGVGWLIGGTWHAALAALLWAGLVRVAVLQHVTWSVNSLCHVLGTRPFATRRYDRATNLWPLALVSFGESWHNMHHSDPACARHGADPGQVDISAAVIRVFERLGWATKVRWPTPAHLDSHRLDSHRLGSHRLGSDLTP
jgi:hypothetical protein